MNILITAGGTSERIDDVRRITNTSTGRLGVAIAQAFFGMGCQIHYVRGLGAVKPEIAGISEYVIQSAQDAEDTLRSVIANNKIDAIIHAMAVSDFRLKSEFQGKISSDADEITLTFAKVPKIIKLFRGLAPDAVIVGFKLVSGVSEGELVDTGHALLTKYDCDLVLANDAAQIDPNNHKGWLIGRDKSYQIFTSKEEIAKGIGEGVMRLWKK